MKTEDALLQLSESTGAAVLGVLSSLAPDNASKGGAVVVPSGTTPLQNIPTPAVAASVSYIDGVTGGNVFVITRLGARRLAATMMFQPPPEEDDRELDELELSAVGEAMNQMMAAGAGATGKVLGQEVEISPPETRQLATARDAEDAYPKTPYATTTSFTVLGETCRLVQLVPNAFVVKMTRALTDRSAELSGSQAAGEHAAPILSPDAIKTIHVRVGAELGRAKLPLAHAVGLATGTVVGLDRNADDPIDLYVNGRAFATGRLLLIDQSEWAIRIEHVHDAAAAYATTSQQGGN
jgi:flagellar motor switch protein FliN/FliY